jgi:para-nitrobenzyl esterase
MFDIEEPAISLSRRRAMVAGLAATIIPASAWAKAGDPAARTSAGPVRGVRDQGVAVFRGIRYGADTRPRRFLSPAPPAPWRDPVAATDYGASSPQRGKGEAKQSEDCLFLNVWTPGLRDGGKRPVMVYLHGGAHASGSGSPPLYDGGALCRRGDVVVVTVNHRLNAFGYCYLSEIDRARYPVGNAGTLDLVLALQWVRDNIAEFGGDPGRVMIFGQSGGGGKVDTLMAMPNAKGLFHSAATMSGSQVTAGGPLASTRKAQAYLKALGVDSTHLDRLQALPTEALVAALDTADPDAEGEKIVWGPVLDHKTLPRHPFFPDAAPLSASIPMVIGSTHDETRYFLRNNPKAWTVGWDDLPAMLAKEMREDIGPDFVMKRYRDIYPDYTPSQILFAASTAGRSWRGHLIKAEMRAAQGANTWVYQLDFPSPVDGGRYGAMHTLDIALVFGTLGVQESMTGTSPAAVAVSDRMSRAFIALARSGDPATPAIPAWPHFGLERRPTMIFDAATRVVDDPRREEREIFELVPYAKPGT